MKALAKVSTAMVMAVFLAGIAFAGDDRHDDRRYDDRRKESDEGVRAGRTATACPSRAEYKNGEKTSVKFYGTIKSISESGKCVWVVNDKEVFVTADTRIEEEHGKASVGAYVEVRGGFLGNAIIAEEIEVKKAAKK